ncbi:MAG TPA: hypothetical protein VF784_00680 [Anaerolineales bacterium]
MSDNHTKGEMHGCIVCGKLYQLYVVTDAQGKFIGCKVMTAGGKVVPNPTRALVACERHTDQEIEAAVLRAYGPQNQDED